MRSALGLSLHTGWAVAVIVAGAPSAPEVVLRRRVPLVDDSLPRQVYHAAADLPAGDAEELVRKVERSAIEMAAREVAAVRDDAVALGHAPAIVAVCAEPRDVPTDVQRIVANHTLIHSAEGDLYREAVEAATESLGLPLVQVDAKRVPAEVTDRLGLSPDRQRALVATLGRELGPPWQADHKQATLLALVALAEIGDSPPVGRTRGVTTRPRELRRRAGR